MLQNRLKLKGKIQILSWVSYIDSMPERKQCTFLEQPMLHDQIWLSPGNEKNNYKANGKKLFLPFFCIEQLVLYSQMYRIPYNHDPC